MRNPTLLIAAIAAYAYDLAREEIIPMLERLLGVLGHPRPSGVIQS